MNFYTDQPHLRPNDKDVIVFPFSPPIFTTFVDDNVIDVLLEKGSALGKEDDHTPYLAGNMKKGGSYHYKEDFLDEFEPFIKDTAYRFLLSLENSLGEGFTGVKNLLDVCPPNTRNGVSEGELFLESMWINYQHEHDFNPPHYHSGALSFVIYCDVPQQVFQGNPTSNIQRSGQITFSHGERSTPLVDTQWSVKPCRNMLLMFPAQLVHTVFPHWIPSVRVSVAGNLRTRYANE